MSFPGRPHNLMSLEELSELVKDSVEPLKQKAEQRLDELSVLMKETTQTLNQWDTETDETITLIHNTRDEHVGLLPTRLILLALHTCLIKFCLIYNHQKTCIGCDFFRAKKDFRRS